MLKLEKNVCSLICMTGHDLHDEIDGDLILAACVSANLDSKVTNRIKKVLQGNPNVLVDDAYRRMYLELFRLFTTPIKPEDEDILFK